MIRYYDGQHASYCGIDLHARSLHVCILDAKGQVVLDKNIAANPTAFLQAIAPFRADVVVGCECMFAWYWLADLCQEEKVPFVVGHAYYMRLIHGAKAKNDKIDAHKIARLLRGGNFPLSYVYPKGMRETRDLLRRRTGLVRLRAGLMTHLQILNAQYNLPPFPKRLAFAANREELDIPARFSDPSVQKSASCDLAVLGCLDEQIRDLELYLTRTAKVDDVQTYHRLRTIPGVGPVLALILLYEIHDVKRFTSAGQLLSYARLVRCSHESDGKVVGSGGQKIGNPTCAGPSARPPACSCAAASGPSAGRRGRPRSAARARPWPSWRRGWPGPSTTCGARARRSTRTASGAARRARRAAKAKRVPLLCPALPRWPMSLIDFRQARSEVQLGRVLELLGWQPRQRHGAQVRGACPLHGSTSPRSRSFSAHLGRGAWQCFRCGASGNALELWALATGQRLYPAVLDLYDRLGQPVPWLRRPRPVTPVGGKTDGIGKTRV